LLPDAEATPERLASILERLLEDPAELERMSAAAAGLGRPDAAEAVADLLEANARPRRQASPAPWRRARVG
ncbi:MAG: hypothetical protein ACRDYC_03125, partial [Acidimicrobiales bacterium]